MYNCKGMPRITYKEYRKPLTRIKESKGPLARKNKCQEPLTRTKESKVSQAEAMSIRKGKGYRRKLQTCNCSFLHHVWKILHIFLKMINELIIRFCKHLPINGLSSKLSLRLDQMVLADLDTFCKSNRKII